MEAENIKPTILSGSNDMFVMLCIMFFSETVQASYCTVGSVKFI